MYINHVFELFMILDPEKFNKLLSRVSDKTGRSDMDDSSISENVGENPESDSPDADTKSEVGSTRDKVAEAVVIKSGRTFDRLREVLERDDELKKASNMDDAELYVAVLNRTPSAARDLYVPLVSLTDEDRERIRTGKVAPRMFLSNQKTDKPKRRTYSGRLWMKYTL